MLSLTPTTSTWKYQHVWQCRAYIGWKSVQGWKFMSCSDCQELGQQASWLLIGYMRVNNHQSESQVSKLTELLTMTTTYKCLSQGEEEMKFQCPCRGCEQQYDTWLALVDHTLLHGHPTRPTLFDSGKLVHNSLSGPSQWKKGPSKS